MTKLKTAVNLNEHDRIYAALVELHAGRSEDESQRINARLILLLMNHIGDEQILGEAFELAAAKAGRNCPGK